MKPSPRTGRSFGAKFAGEAMKIFGAYGLAVVVTVGVTAVLLTLPSRHFTALAQTPANPAATTAEKGEVERGRYLVEDVAMCGECHTPRNEHGELRTDAWLKGAVAIGLLEDLLAIVTDHDNCAGQLLRRDSLIYKLADGGEVSAFRRDCSGFGRS